MTKDLVEFVAREYCNIKIWYDDGLSKQPSLNPEGLKSLKECIAEFHGGAVSSENILLTSGVTEAIFLAALAFIQEGNTVGAFDPYFYQFRLVTRLFGGSFVPILLTCGRKTEIHQNSLREAKEKGLDFFWFNNPHNPTGKVFESAEIKEVSEALGKHTVIFSDEVYSHTVYDGSFHSMIEWIDPRVIVANSLSKNHLRPDLRIGWIIADRPVIRTLTALQDVVLFSLPTLTQTVAETVVRGPVSQDIGLLLDNSSYVKRHLSQTLKAFPSAGTIYMFVLFPPCARMGEMCKEANARFGNVCMPSSVLSQYYTSAMRLRIDIEQSRLAELVKFVNDFATRAVLANADQNGQELPGPQCP